MECCIAPTAWPGYLPHVLNGSVLPYPTSGTKALIADTFGALLHAKTVRGLSPTGGELSDNTFFLAAS